MEHEKVQFAMTGDYVFLRFFRRDYVLQMAKKMNLIAEQVRKVLKRRKRIRD